MCQKARLLDADSLPWTPTFPCYKLRKIEWSSLRTCAPVAVFDLAKGLLLEERQLVEEVSELEALIPFDMHEGVGEPVESETPHQCAFIPQGLRALRM